MSAFSVQLNWEVFGEEETIHVEGQATDYIPATGPTMENAGGDPPEGGELEDLVFTFAKDGAPLSPEFEKMLLDDAAFMHALEERVVDYFDF